MSTKHIIIKLIFTFVSFLTLTTCQKAPINGNLDGQWQIVSVYPEAHEIIIKERLYYCFYMHVCMLTYYDGVLTTGNMLFENNKLFLDFPHANGYDTIKKLKQYGIYSNPTVFNIEHLDKNNLILQNDFATITLRKF